MTESSVGIAGGIVAVLIFLWRSGLIQFLFERWLNRQQGRKSPLLNPGRAVDRLRKLLDERMKLRLRKRDGESRLKDLDKEIMDLRKIVLDDDKEEE